MKCDPTCHFDPTCFTPSRRRVKKFLMGQTLIRKAKNASKRDRLTKMSEIIYLAQGLFNGPIQKFFRYKLSRSRKIPAKFSDFHSNVDYFFIFYQYFATDLEIKILRV